MLPSYLLHYDYAVALECGRAADFLVPALLVLRMREGSREGRQHGECVVVVRHSIYSNTGRSLEYYVLVDRSVHMKSLFFIYLVKFFVYLLFRRKERVASGSEMTRRTRCAGGVGGRPITYRSIAVVPAATHRRE